MTILVDNEPMASYLANDHISASDLKILLNKSPYHFQNRSQIKNESDSLSFGTLCHTAILEPEIYDTYVLEPKIDKRTKEWKAWLAENEGKTTVSEDDAARIKLIKTRMQQVGILPIFSRGESEVSAYGEHMDLKIRARADKWDPERRIVVDLKTTRDLQWFTKDIFRYGYDLSVPHYSQLFANAANCAPEDITYIFVAVESVGPHDCGWYVLSGENIARARANWELALTRCKVVLESGSTQGFTMPSPLEV
jgi:hypothetical protein